mgnify:CR=1 FL=1
MTKWHKGPEQRDGKLVPEVVQFPLRIDCDRLHVDSAHARTSTEIAEQRLPAAGNSGDKTESQNA